MKHPRYKRKPLRSVKKSKRKKYPNGNWLDQVKVDEMSLMASCSWGKELKDSWHCAEAVGFAILAIESAGASVTLAAVLGVGSVTEGCEDLCACLDEAIGYVVEGFMNAPP